MKNKKIVVFLLIAVLVLGMTLTALVGCKDYKDVEYSEMSDFLATAIENTAEGKNINSMKLGATMTIDTTYGDSSKTYTIDLAASLALKKDSSDTNQASLEIKEGEKNIVSAYYYESTTAAKAPVYLKLGESTRFKLNAFNVKEILNKNDASVSNEQSEEIAEATVDGITSFLDMLEMVAGFDGVKAQVSKKGTSYRLAINLGDLLNGLLNDPEDTSIPELVSGILSELNLDVDAKNLGAILPSIELGININVSSKKAENAVITGVSADLSCPSKEVKLAKKSGGNLLELNISKDFTAKADIVFNFGDSVQVKSDDWNAYPAAGIGAINLTAKGTFELKNEIKIDNLFNVLKNVEIPADTYDLEIGISADPAKLVDKNFTNIHSLPHAIDVAIDAVNTAVDYLNIKITKQSGEVFLQVELAKANANADLSIKTINVAALGLDSGITTILKGSIKTIWTSLTDLKINDKPLFELPANLDNGYVYANGTDYKDGYLVDTANGYVDEDNDGNPDKDENGNFAVAEDYELYKGLPLHKSECGYVKDSEGNWKVDVDHGYVATNKNNVKIKYDDNGDFAVNTKEGYTLYQRKDADGKAIDPRPIPHNDLTEEEKKEIADSKAESSLIPDSVKDLINNLAIVGKDGKVSVNLSGMSFALDSKAQDVKYATLSALLGLDKTGITVSATVTGLDEVKVKGDDGVYTSLGLPAEIGVEIVIKFTDIKYGAIK